MSEIACRKCGCGINNMYIKEKGTHIGLYCKCSDEGTWQTWLSKDAYFLYKDKGVKIEGTISKYPDIPAQPSENIKEDNYVGSRKPKNYKYDSKTGCPKCGCRRTITRQGAMHKGLYCAECGRWLTWVKNK